MTPRTLALSLGLALSLLGAGPAAAQSKDPKKKPEPAPVAAPAPAPAPAPTPTPTPTPKGGDAPVQRSAPLVLSWGPPQDEKPPAPGTVRASWGPAPKAEDKGALAALGAKKGRLKRILYKLPILRRRAPTS